MALAAGTLPAAAQQAARPQAYCLEVKNTAARDLRLQARTQYHNGSYRVSLVSL